MKLFNYLKENFLTKIIKINYLDLNYNQFLLKIIKNDKKR